MDNNKLIQQQRVIECFVKSAEKIISEEGIEKLSTRKVAKGAGYNVATLYNYFKNFNHLIIFISVKHLDKYIDDMDNYINDSMSHYDIYVESWRCFLKHSFINPRSFYLMFFSDFSNKILAESIEKYRQIYPGSLSSKSENLKLLLTIANLGERNAKITKLLKEEYSFLSDEDTQEISEITLMFYQSALYNYLNKQNHEDFNIEKLIKYIKKVLLGYGIK